VPRINPKTGEYNTLLFGAITQGATGTTVLVAADPTKKIRLVSYVVVLDAAGTFKFSDGSADLTGAMPASINSGVAIQGDGESVIIETGAINRALSIVTAGGKAFGHFSYFLEA
jgi:hypothetical protein